VLNDTLDFELIVCDEGHRYKQPSEICN